MKSASQCSFPGALSTCSFTCISQLSHSPSQSPTLQVKPHSPRAFCSSVPCILPAKQTSKINRKITQFLNLLMDKTLKWATLLWEKGSEPCSSYEHCTVMFHRVFYHSHEEKEVGEGLFAVKQGNWHATDYAVEFCTLAAGLQVE